MRSLRSASPSPRTSTESGTATWGHQRSRASMAASANAQAAPSAYAKRRVTAVPLRGAEVSSS